MSRKRTVLYVYAEESRERKLFGYVTERVNIYWHIIGLIQQDLDLDSFFSLIKLVKFTRSTAIWACGLDAFPLAQRALPRPPQSEYSASYNSAEDAEDAAVAAIVAVSAQQPLPRQSPASRRPHPESASGSPHLVRARNRGAVPRTPTALAAAERSSARRPGRQGALAWQRPGSRRRTGTRYSRRFDAD